MLTIANEIIWQYIFAICLQIANGMAQFVAVKPSGKVVVISSLPGTKFSYNECVSPAMVKLFDVTRPIIS
jgi:hypothetical protein